MTLFIAYNTALDSGATALAGVTYTSGGTRIAIQVAPPSGMDLRLVEWGVSFNGNALGTPAVCTLVQSSSASTVVAHSDTTIKAIGDREVVSGLTYGTSATGYGSGSQAAAGTTTEKEYAAAYVGPLSQYEKQFPLGRDYVVTGGKFCQLRITPPASMTAIGYVLFEKC